MRLEVEDTGLGIPQEIEPYLFNDWIASSKRPARLHGGKERGGRGEFLAMLHKRVVPLGARVGYQNKGKNNGAIFWYEIPLKLLIGNKL